MGLEGFRERNRRACKTKISKGAFTTCKKRKNDKCPPWLVEANEIEHNKDKKTKGIYGKASSEEISDLIDEGIETEIVPWFNDNEN